MKLLFDQNISYRVVKKNSGVFPECLHVSRTGLTTPASDEEIWEYARRHHYSIVTNDEDFCHLVMLRGAPPKMIWLRFGNASTNEVAEKLLYHTEAIKALQQSDIVHMLEVY
jgi:predicted nuclease of predicted toxin-antitoxin system